MDGKSTAPSGNIGSVVSLRSVAAGRGRRAQLTSGYASSVVSSDIQMPNACVDWSPLSSRANVISVPSVACANPARPTTPVSVPVFARTLPATAVFANRRSSVPVSPATERSFVRSACGPARSSTLVSRLHVARLPRSSPEPSIIVNPSTGIPSSFRCDATAAVPAAVEPAPDASYPISFNRSSAVPLSLSLSSSPITSGSGAPSIDAISHRARRARHPTRRPRSSRRARRADPPESGRQTPLDSLPHGTSCCS